MTLHRTDRPGIGQKELILDFSSLEQIACWKPVDDGVMGGVSSSSFLKTSQGTALFSGELSLDRGGGFASVRSTGVLPKPLGASTLVLAARGDGRCYQLRLRTNAMQDELSYLAPIKTQPNVWSEFSFQSSMFCPSRRGRVVPGAPALNFADVVSFGFLLAERQAGAFRLELAWLAGS